MADFTASVAAFNSGATLNLLALQASQTVDVSGVGDERVVLIVQNNNDSVAVNTATITIAPGGFLASVLGTLSVDVADGGTCKVIGPLEGARFRSTASKLTVGCSVTQSGTVSGVKMAVVKLP
jgi:ABC-type protease/lipase transport system fused ATPase/permease subunit